MENHIKPFEATLSTIYGLQNSTYEKMGKVNTNFVQKLTVTNATLKMINDNEKIDLLKALDPLSKEEYKRLVDFSTNQTGTDTTDLIKVFPVSFQMKMPKIRQEHKHIQVSIGDSKTYGIDKSTSMVAKPILYEVEKAHHSTIEMLSPFMGNSRNLIDLEKVEEEFDSNSNSQLNDNSEAKNLNLLEIEDDENDDDEEDDLEEDYDVNESKTGTETDGNDINADKGDISGFGVKEGRMREVDETKRSFEKRERNDSASQSPREKSSKKRRKSERKTGMAPKNFLENMETNQKAISIKGLNAVKDYFDKALQEKSGEDLKKDKQYLKNLIRKLDEFLEFNKTSISKSDQEMLEQKRKLLEKVESKILDFSEMQTKFYKTISNQDQFKRLSDSILRGGDLRSSIFDNSRIPNLNLIKQKQRNNEIVAESTMVLQKILMKNRKGKIHKSAYLMKSGSLLVLISKVYNEYTNIAEKAKKEQKDFPSIPLTIYFYRYMSMQITNKASLQRNYEKVLGSLINTVSLPACDLFGKFLGITGNYDHGCFEIFIDILLYARKAMKNELINRREKDRMMITWLRMQELNNYYVNNYVFTEPTKTKDAILNVLIGLREAKSGTLQIDFELAMIRVLEIHMATQIPVRQFIFRTADVKLFH